MAPTPAKGSLDAYAAQQDYKLTEQEGRNVRRSHIEVTNAGDGLSNAMKVEPREFHHGERVYVVLETVVAKVRFDPLNRDDYEGDLVRVHVLKAGAATIVDADLVATQIEAQKTRQQEAIERSAGIQQLDLGGAAGGDTPAEPQPGDMTDEELAEFEADLAAREAAGRNEPTDPPPAEPEVVTPLKKPAKRASRAAKKAKA